MSSSLPKNTNEIIENILKIEDVKKLFKNKTAEFIDYKIIQDYMTPYTARRKNKFVERQ